MFVMFLFMVMDNMQDLPQYVQSELFKMIVTTCLYPYTISYGYIRIINLQNGDGFNYGCLNKYAIEDNIESIYVIRSRV